MIHKIAIVIFFLILETSIYAITSEDALNIIRSSFIINQCSFNNNSSDHFDSDFIFNTPFCTQRRNFISFSAMIHRIIQ